MKKIILSFGLFFPVVFASAQLEAIHFSSRYFSRSGPGIFLNTGFPVNRGGMITAEGEVGFFKQGVTAVPLALGYRQSLNGKGYGWYVEPQLSYTFMSTDLPMSDLHKIFPPGPERSFHQPDLNGITAGFGAGYVFPGKFALNLGLRYAHIFVAGSPQADVLSLRATHTIICGRRRGLSR